MTRFLLLPSPLLGPATWAPVAEALGRLGHDAAVVPVGDLSDADGAVLVPHSNAGYWTPGLAARLGAPAAVYVDAALPAYDAPETVLAPPDFRTFLAGLADADGLLPPWTRWWEDLGDLFPDQATRLAVEAEQPRLPLTWFDQRVAVPTGWAGRPAAYLGFGATYAAEQAFAADQGWPVERLAGEHLHQLHDAAAVAAAVVRLADRVVGPTPRSSAS